MRHAVIKSLAVGAILSLAVATSCSISTRSTKSSSPGKPLVIDDTPLSPMTDTFNPYSATSTGGPGGVTAQGLYDEPLFIWNILNPSEAPFKILGMGYSWSNGGRTLTITTRSGVKWNDGKPFSASDVAFTFNMIRTHPGPGQRHGAQRDDRGAELQRAGVLQSVPDRPGLYRARAHLVEGEPGHVRRPEPGWHRPVHA